MKKTPHEIVIERLKRQRDRLDGNEAQKNWKGCIEREAVIEELEFLCYRFLVEGYKPPKEGA